MQKSGAAWALSVAGIAMTAVTIAAAAAPQNKPAEVARGKYLVSAMGCNDCHTPLKMGPKGPEPDMSRLLSGHPEQVKLPPPPKPTGPWIWGGDATNTAFYGPWGVDYAMNLTPDKNTGLGIWTEAMFIEALRTGKHMGTSRPINPPMPWQSFGRLSDADLKAMFAYLQTIPPIVNHVPDYRPPTPAGRGGK
ncbi:MAG TPA: c-type cytochrome [Vicinamibacterales bacterium]|nr:c-type cytochrome [Vicinamibacterales bacterium]